MSKPRYKWWSYVKWMIRLYPERKEEIRRRMEPSVTPKYNAMPGGTDVSRTTEQLGLVSLGKTIDKEVEAVERAIEATNRMKDGAGRLDLIRLVLWAGTHTLPGACVECHVSERTGRRWHTDFIHLVARNFGLE